MVKLERKTNNLREITLLFTETEATPASSRTAMEQEPEPVSTPLIPRLPYLPSARKSLPATRKTSPTTTKDEQNLSNLSQKVSMTKESVTHIAEDMLSSTKEVISNLYNIFLYYKQLHKLCMQNTSQPLYSTIFGVHSTNRVR